MSGEGHNSVAGQRLRSFIDRVLRLKEEGASRDEIRRAYRGLDGDEKNYVFAIVRQTHQPRQGWRVYFASFPKIGLLKIGISRDVAARLNALAAQKNAPAELLLDFPGMFALEGWYHAAFHDWRVEGEWFRLCEETLAEVERIRAEGPAIVLEAA